MKCIELQGNLRQNLLPVEPCISCPINMARGFAWENGYVKLRMQITM